MMMVEDNEVTSFDIIVFTKDKSKLHSGWKIDSKYVTFVRRAVVDVKLRSIRDCCIKVVSFIVIKTKINRFVMGNINVFWTN